MTQRIYLVPVLEIDIGDGKIARGPKYFSFHPQAPEPLITPAKFSGMRFGGEGTYLVVADVTGGEHNTLSAQSDVTSLPINIDNTITSAALPAVRDALEDLGIPGTWIQANTHTYREVLRMVGGRERFVPGADQEVASISHRIKMRERSDIVLSPKTHRLVWGTRVFDVEAVVDPDGRAREVLCFCNERVGETYGG